MKKLLSILFFIILSILLLISCGKDIKLKENQDMFLKQQNKLIEKCIMDFEYIKIGMTRNEIEKRFLLDGGLQSIASPIRFTHPNCPYFKINIEFAFTKNPDDQNRAISKKEDKVIKVSKPYIERPFTD